MTTYDVYDEAVLEATPQQLRQALVDEAQGRSGWWQPRVRLRQVADLPITEVGGIVELAVSGEHPGRTWDTVRFSARVIGTDGDRQLTLRAFDGDFRGVEDWTFDPVDERHTRIALHWQMRPHGRLRLVAPFVDVAAAHSQVVREGFRAVERYVRARQPSDSTESASTIV